VDVSDGVCFKLSLSPIQFPLNIVIILSVNAYLCEMAL
jgi:hypothetical protein